MQLQPLLILKELLEIAEKDHNINNRDELLSFQNKPIRNFQVPTRTYKRLKDKLEELPEAPGVYYYKDKDGKYTVRRKGKIAEKTGEIIFQP
jgi:hypothetical protein